jgi:hypothetical protein
MKSSHIERKLTRAAGGTLCRCGGPAVYIAHWTGRRAKCLKALCEIHGRAYAIRWDLELPE